MARFSSTAPVRSDSAANIAAWVQLTHDALLAVGCIQTEDTGQLDTAAIAGPVLNTAADLGWRMYELNDSLSGDFPIFIQVSFAPRIMTGSNNQYAVPGGYIRVGFATNGAGGFVGPYIGSYYTFPSIAGTSGGINYHASPLTAACKLDGYLGVAVGCGCAAHASAPRNATPFLCSVLRSRDVNGEPTGDGVIVILSGGVSAGVSDYADAGYMWATRSPELISGLLRPVFASPPEGMMGGLAHATPAMLSMGSRVFTDDNMLAVPAAAGAGGTILKLSSDDFTDREYLILPYATASSVASSAGSVCWVPDSRNRYTNAIAMRFE